MVFFVRRSGRQVKKKEEQGKKVLFSILSRKDGGQIARQAGGEVWKEVWGVDPYRHDTSVERARQHEKERNTRRDKAFSTPFLGLPPGTRIPRGKKTDFSTIL